MLWKKWIWRITKWLFGTLLFLFLTISAIIYFYKDEIINYAVGEVNKNLATKVEVGKIDVTFWATFPNLSLDFNHVFVQDALPNSTRKDTLLFTEQIRLKFDPFDIWNKKYHVKRIDVKPGTLQLKVNETGEVNYNILKESGSSENSNFKLNLEKIYLHKIRFSFKNAIQETEYSAMVNELNLKGQFTQDEFLMATDADLTVRKIRHGLIPILVNQPVKTSLNIAINKPQETFSITDGVLHLASIPFDFKLLLDSTHLDLNVKSTNIPVQEIANRLSVREMEDVKALRGQGVGYFNLHLTNELSVESHPLVDCSFGIKQGQLVEPVKQLRLSNIQLTGEYSTLKGPGNEELNLKNFSFNTISGPFKGNLFIKNFSKPYYKGMASGSVKLDVLQAVLRIPKIENLDGVIQVNAKFACKTNTVNAKNIISIDEGSGSAGMQNVSFQLEKDSRKFYGINGNVVLDKSAASLEDLVVKLGESDLHLNGSFDHIDAFLQDESKLDVKVIAESRLVNLGDFNNTIVGETKVAIQSRDWMLPTKIQGNVILDVGKIQMNEHQFTQIQGEMTVGERSISIQKLHGISANATVRGALNVYESSPEYFQLETSLSSKDIYFKPIFKEWNNFDQQVITENNINGRAEAILDLKAPFLIGTGILKDEIIAQIQLKVFNGTLKNVETFTALTNDLKSAKTKMILKSRDINALQNKLNNISFETLENTIYIKNSAIFIPKMEINSNAIDVTVDGTHKFNNTVDYRFAFRFRDLKQQKDESEFGIVEDDGSGVKIFVHMFGNLNNPTIEWDQESRKQQAKENREVAKQEAISILKTEFGLFKKDTTIQKYQPRKQEREVIEIKFGKEEEVNPFEEKKKIEKEKKGLKKFGDKLKQKQKDENENESFTID